MADIFDLSSTKSSRGSYDDSTSRYKDWDSNNKMRRDPRLKSPKHEEQGIVSRSQKSRDPRQCQEENSQSKQNNPPPPRDNNWMSNQINYRQMPSYNIVPPTSQSMMSNMYDQQRQQQYNTSYPPPMNQNNYQYIPSDISGQQQSQQRMQPDYSSNQYQAPMPPSYYSNMNSDGNYMQAPPPPTWQSQSSSTPQPPPPPRMHLTPPPPGSTPQSELSDDFNKKEAAIVQEMKQQRATFRKQRDEYYQRASLLKRELDVLQSQKKEILSEVGSGSIPRETQRILKENGKLQLEIQAKLKTINNVIEMFTGIINGETASETTHRGNSRERQSSTSELRSNTPNKELLSSVMQQTTPVYNYVHYDPELHWCRVCDVFPTSAKDFLIHLHSDKHRETTKQHKLVDMPWHNMPLDPEFPSNADGPVKRTPIKGIQFFIPATAWYCKLCDKWIGDLHCASAHLKSKLHIQNFTNFIEQNPHWETDWITDREKAYARAQNKSTTQEVLDTSNLIDPSLNSDKLKKRKKHNKRDSRSSSREKKKKRKSKKRKKVSSDSSSDSSSSTETSSDDDDDIDDKSRSIRVAMRNKMKMQAQMILNEELGGKLDVLTKLVEDGAQRNKQRKSDAITTPPTPAEDTKPEDKSVAVKILPKDKDILTFHTFRNRLKQSQNFKQSQAVSLNLLANKKEDGSNEKESPKKDRFRSDSHGSNDADRTRSRYSDDRRRRYSRSPRSNRYVRSPDRRYRRDSSPRRYDRYGSPNRKRNYDRRDSSPGFRERKSFDDKYGKKSEKYSKDDSDYKKDEKKRSDESKSDKSESTTDDKGKFSTTQKKMPLIGRMPLFKKKQDLDDKKNSDEKNKSKFVANENTLNLPAPGLVHMPKLATIAPFQFSADNPPPPPQIIPDPPMIMPEPPQIAQYMCAPPPPMLSQQMMMEIPAEQIIMLQPEPPQQQPQPPAQEPGKGGLPPDLQDALNIIFPGDKSKEEQPHSDELIMAEQYSVVDNTYYAGYDTSFNPGEMMPPLPPDISGQNQPLDMLKNPAEDDLAMLGIDAEDLAAQNL